MESGDNLPENIGNELEKDESLLWQHIAASHLPKHSHFSSIAHPTSGSSPCSKCDHALPLGGNFSQFVCIEHRDTHSIDKDSACPDFVKIEMP